MISEKNLGLWLFLLTSLLKEAINTLKWTPVAKNATAGTTNATAGDTTGATNSTRGTNPITREGYPQQYLQMLMR